MLQYSLKAYAKINLTLDIINTDDRGYHYVNTVMQSISLADKISILIQPSLNGKINLICYDKCLPNNEKNIVYKAAVLFFMLTKIENPGISLRINKKIPKSSGLGGGSADAAATLRALNVLFDARLSYNELIKMAAELGTDVPFCIKGGTQYGTNFGEKLVDINQIDDKNYYLILVKAARKPSTKEMYKRFDSSNYHEISQNENVVEYLNAGNTEMALLNINNCFEFAWKHSVLPKILLNLKQLGAISVNITGSGPTVYGIFNDKITSQKAARTLRKEFKTVIEAKFQPAEGKI